MFQIVDKDRDGYVSEKEWQEFYTVMIKPFKTYCDRNKNFLIDEEELKNCMNSIKSLARLKEILDHESKDKPNL